MFKLAVLAAVLAVAVAAPGGLTGIVLDHGLGPIHAPQVISHSAPVAAHVVHQPVVHQQPIVQSVAHVVHEPVHVVHQPIAPVVHRQPIVTKTVLTHPVFPLVHGHGLVH
ncbi:uncharacterized protein [Prorops nasuta]|uniref:uncharacterized protein isoform X1 n=1 Tax=Prorops nasuta TaxID=863751 RepID=UPI0034CED782